LVKTSGEETSRYLALGVVSGGDFSLSSTVGGAATAGDSCSSNALRYKERRYCSKYTTSNSKTAISLIKSVVGWFKKKPLSDRKKFANTINQNHT
jgi:hypothetical protein